MTTYATILTALPNTHWCNCVAQKRVAINMHVRRCPRYKQRAGGEIHSITMQSTELTGGRNRATRTHQDIISIVGTSGCLAARASTSLSVYSASIALIGSSGVIEAALGLRRAGAAGQRFGYLEDTHVWAMGRRSRNTSCVGGETRIERKREGRKHGRSW